MHLTDDGLPAEGSTLAGKYVVGGVLGRGGMGVVLEAKHLRLGRPVALKVLLPHLRKQPDVTMRFEREARNASRLTGPNAARVLDVDVLADGSPFMVMELLQGTELGQEILRRGALPIEEAIGIVLEACAAMEEAHGIGIVHRDLKPSNLFLAESGKKRTVKVLDFGISKSTGEGAAALTATQTAFGTPMYMSPEQVRSARTVDGRADIWSLGVILYESLTGKPPFDAPTPTAILAAIIADAPRPILSLRSDLPPSLAAAVMRTLLKDPAERFPDVRAFAAAIAPFGPPDAVKRWGSAPEDPRRVEAISMRTAVAGDPHDAPTLLRMPKRKMSTGMVALVAGLSLVVGGLAIAIAVSVLAPAEQSPPIAATAAPDAKASVSPTAVTPAANAPVEAAAAGAPQEPVRAPEDVKPPASAKPAAGSTAKAGASSAAPVRSAPSATPSAAPAATVDPTYL